MKNAPNNGPTSPIHPQIPDTIRRALLFCGILSSLLFVGMDLFAAQQWEGYSYVDQAFSELTAVEAPTRTLMVLGVSIPYNLLVIAFAYGIWRSADGKRALRIMAVMIFVHAVAGFTGSFFFPMHSRGAEKTMMLTDNMHIVSTIVEVLSMLLAIGFGAAAFGKRFRIYSIATIVLLLLGGTLAGVQGKRVAEDLPTPWMGVTERINIYAFMLWAIVLGFILLQREKTLANKKQIVLS